MPRLHPLKLSSIVLTILLVCPAAGRAQVERFARGTKGYARDQQRVATVTRVKSLADLLASSSPLTGSRVPKGDASWRSWGEGVKPFSVEMGGGCQVTGVAQRYDLGPLGSTVKLRELAVQKGARRVAVSLDVPVRLDYDTAFYYGDGRSPSVVWHGPESKLSVVAFLHERGHSADFKGMSEAERASFIDIYDRKTNEQPLSDLQQRAMVGFERRAWASALRDLRSLKRQGVDLLGDVSRKELMDTIYSCLKGYYDYQGKKPASPR